MELRARMIKHATFKGHKYPDDIAQEYCMRLLEGLHKHATVGQAYIDILRKTQAGTRNEKSFMAQTNLLNPHPESEKILGLLLEDTRIISLDEQIDLKQVLEALPREKDRQFLLRRLDGCTHAELAAEEGVTASLIHQRETKLLDKLRLKYNKL
jgi:RNA polymerase sigma factor (sigma-70 family)